MWPRALVVAVALLLPACANPRPATPPPPGPALDDAALAMPADLDVVVRVDMVRVTSALGAEGKRALERLLTRAPGSEPDAETGRLLLNLLTRTRTAWLGARPGLSPELTDNVLVLRGDFAGLLPARLGGVPAWGARRDLGSSVWRFERDAPAVRAAPAVLYFRGPDLAVLGSFAEIDALERSIEQRRGEPPLRAPDRGVVSLAMRLAALRQRLEPRAPFLSQFFSGAERLEATLDLRGAEVALDIEIAFDAKERAEVTAEALRRLVGVLAKPERRWLERTAVSVLERFVSVRLKLPEALVLRLLAGLTGAASPNGDRVPPP